MIQVTSTRCGFEFLPVMFKPGTESMPGDGSQPLVGVMTSSQRVYEVRPRKDRRGFDLMSHVLPFGRLWYSRRVSDCRMANNAATIRVDSAF